MKIRSSNFVDMSDKRELGRVPCLKIEDLNTGHFTSLDLRLGPSCVLRPSFPLQRPPVAYPVQRLREVKWSNSFYDKLDK